MISQFHYCNFVKLFMQMLRTNIVLAASEGGNILELPVIFMSRNFCWTIKLLHQTPTATNLKLAKIQLTVLAELHKMFPNNFHGTATMVQTVVELRCCEGELSHELTALTTKFKDILWNQRHKQSFYSDFFDDFNDPSNRKMVSMYELCIEVIDDVSGDGGDLMRIAMSTNENSNFCLLLIKSMSSNPHLNPTMFNQIILKITQLICAKNLDEKNFQFIEKELVKRILSNDYWMSFVSFSVFSEFLSQPKPTGAYSHYFKFFQKLLLKMWNLSTNPTSMSQLYIISIVKQMLKIHPELARHNDIDQSLFFLLNESSAPNKLQTSFLKALRLTIDTPSAANYYATMISLKLMAMGGINDSSCEAVPKFSELITTVVNNCNWNLHRGLMISIMEVMISTTDSQNKIIFLLKLNPALSNVENKPFEVKLKLLDLLLSYIPMSKLKIGLPGILIREFNKLLCDDSLVVQRAVLRKIESNFYNPDVMELTNSLTFDCDSKIVLTEDEILKLIIQSKGFKSVHKCPVIKHVEASQASSRPSIYLQPLYKILKYSETIQPHQLNENDQKIIQKIITNFQAIERGRNPLKRNGTNGFN